MLIPAILLTLVHAVTAPSAAAEPPEVVTARHEVERAPRRAEPLGRLAERLCDLHAATLDDAALREAEQLVARAAQAEPGSPALRLAEARVALARGDLAAALETARGLNRRAPDHLPTYALIVNAALASGRVAEAEEAASWMLRLRDDEPLSLLSAAAVRAAIGDTDGAVELWVSASERTQPTHALERSTAWTSAGEALLLADRVAESEAVLRRALEEWPGHDRAAALLAQALLGSDRPQSALQALEARASSPRVLLVRAGALEQLGRSRESAAAWATLEEPVAAGLADPDVVRALVLRKLSASRDARAALAVAEGAAARRRDPVTLDALAWAQWATGDRAVARATMREALAPGYRDATMSAHASAMGLTEPTAGRAPANPRRAARRAG